MSVRPFQQPTGPAQSGVERASYQARRPQSVSRAEKISFDEVLDLEPIEPIPIRQGRSHAGGRDFPHRGAKIDIRI